MAKALWSAGANVYALSKTKENLDKLVAEVSGVFHFRLLVTVLTEMPCFCLHRDENEGTTSVVGPVSRGTLWPPLIAGLMFGTASITLVTLDNCI